MILELKDGNLLAPMGVFDVLDCIEEYMGTEVRQYLEDYFSDEDPWAGLPDNIKTARWQEHFETVLDAIDDALANINRLVNQSHIPRAKIVDCLQGIKTLIMKERENCGKESV